MDIAAKPKKITYKINGEQHQSFDQVPDFMKKYFEDKDQNGIPDIFEIEIEEAKGNNPNPVFYVNGKVYNSVDELKDAMGQDFIAGMFKQIGKENLDKVLSGNSKVRLGVGMNRKLIFIIFGGYLLYKYLFEVLLPALGWI